MLFSRLKINVKRFRGSSSPGCCHEGVQMKAEMSKTKRTTDIAGLLIEEQKTLQQIITSLDGTPGPSIPLTPSSAACFSAGGCLCCSNRRNCTQQLVQLKPRGMESGAAPQEDGVKVCQVSPELCFSAEQLLLVWKEHCSVLVKSH